ncbi:MAG: hypothetical protein ACXU86_16120, partial [Archangium sp.]
VARGVDGNTLAIRNNHPGGAPEGQGQLQITDLQVGWLDQSKLPKPVSAVPKRAGLTGGLTVAGLRLAQSTRGGFSVSFGGLELLGETALGTVLGDSMLTGIRDDQVRPIMKQGGWEHLLELMRKKNAELSKK